MENILRKIPVTVKQSEQEQVEVLFDVAKKYSSVSNQRKEDGSIVFYFPNTAQANLFISSCKKMKGCQVLGAPEVSNVGSGSKMESTKMKSFTEFVKTVYKEEVSEAARPEDINTDVDNVASEEIESDQDADMKSQMIATAKECCPDADEMDIEAAIYWLASDYHEGQDSDLYSIVSTSEYKPGPMEKNVDSAGEIARMIYDELESKFVSKAEPKPEQSEEVVESKKQKKCSKKGKTKKAQTFADLW